MSTLSFEDTVRIIAHYYNVYESKSRTTLSELKARGYTEDQIKALGNNVDSLTIESCGIRIRGDVSKISYEYFDYVNQLYDAFENGILPFDGGYADQPAQIIQIFMILRILRLESRQRQIEEQKKIDRMNSGRRK